MNASARGEWGERMGLLHSPLLMEETIMRGRTPSGPDYVQHLEGSQDARKRVQRILQTMAGTKRVRDVCAELKISEQRFRQLRAEILQAAVHRAEGGSAGRPPRPTEPEPVLALRQQVAQLQQELEVARVREEVALVLPHVALPPTRQAEAQPGPATKAEQAPAEQAAPQKKRWTRRRKRS